MLGVCGVVLGVPACLYGVYTWQTRVKKERAETKISEAKAKNIEEQQKAETKIAEAKAKNIEEQQKAETKIAEATVKSLELDIKLKEAELKAKTR